MELVIKIPEEKYQTIINHTEEILDESSFIEPKYLYRAVLDGTPLPKGHGDLKDVDAIMRELSVVSSRPVKSQMYIIKDAPTIIEADGGVKDEDRD